MDSENGQNQHPFVRRGKTLHELLFRSMKDGPVEWSDLLRSTKALDYMDDTVVRAVREGVDFGALRKSGGRGTGKPALVSLTYLGHQWFTENLADARSLGECYGCGRAGTHLHHKYGAECDECAAVPDEPEIELPGPVIL